LLEVVEALEVAYAALIAVVLFELLLYMISYVNPKVREGLRSRNIEVAPLMLLIDVGKASKLEKLSSRVNSKLLRYGLLVAGLLSVAISATLMYQILVNSVGDLIKAFSARETYQSPLVPIIPGVTISLNIIPTLAVVIGFSVAIHELMHAIASYIEGVKVESWGLGLFAIFPLAYVKPVEEVFNKARRLSKFSILSAGVLGNLIVAILATALMSFLTPHIFLTPVIVDLDRSNPDLPAVKAGLPTPSIIVEVNNTRISSIQDFTAFLLKIRNDSVVIELKVIEAKIEGDIVKPSGGLRTYYLYKPSNSKLGVYLTEYVSENTSLIVLNAYKTLYWFYIVNFSLALVNATPVFITDGGRILSEILKDGRYKLVNYTIQTLTSSTLALLLIIGLLNALA